MHFYVISQERLKELAEEVVTERLKKIAALSPETGVWIRDDLSFFNENELPPMSKIIWQIAKHFDILKSRLFHIDPKQTVASLNLIEKELATEAQSNKKLLQVFNDVIVKFNSLNKDAPPYESLTLPIHEAVINDDLPAVIHMAEKNKSYIMQTNSEGETPLHVALRLKRSSIAAFLVHEHPSPVEQDLHYQYTPLHLAILNDDYDIAKKILDKGVSMESCDIFGRTPLVLAVETKNRRCAKLLERYKAMRANNF